LRRLRLQFQYESNTKSLEDIRFLRNQKKRLFVLKERAAFRC
jgi:hypothetical protein